MLYLICHNSTQFVDQQHQRAALLDNLGGDRNVGRLENEVGETAEVVRAVELGRRRRAVAQIGEQFDNGRLGNVGLNVQHERAHIGRLQRAYRIVKRHAVCRHDERRCRVMGS